MSFLKRWKRRLSARLRGPGTSPPIFVFGHQKSGTTAIAALFAELIGEPYHHDLFYEHGWLDNHELVTGGLDAESLALRAPGAFAGGVTKDPDFTFAMPDILGRQPDAAAIFVIREPKAMIASVLGRLGIPGDAPAIGTQLDTLRPVEHTLWSNVLDCEGQGFPHGNHIAALSHRWLLAADLFDACRDRCILLRYEDFRTDKKGTLESLADRLGREVKSDIAPHLDKQFQPGSKRPADFRSFFGEENYALITSLCQDRMARFGYAND